MLPSIWEKLQLRDFQHSLELVARLVRVGFVIAASRTLMGENGLAWVKAKRERVKRLAMNFMFVRSVSMPFLTLWYAL